MGIFTASDKVRFKKVKEEGCEVLFSVEVPAAKVSDETHNVLLNIQQRARVPGFRQGKAPIELIKKQFAGHAQEETLDRLIRRHVPEALKELQLQPVATPSVEEVKFDNGKPLLFQVRIETAPKLSPKDYTKIPVSKKSYPADEAAITARVEELREAHARLERATEESVAKNHYVVIDYAGKQAGKPMANAKGENELVDLSSEHTLEGLSSGLLGMKRGETKDVPVKFNNKEAAMTVTIKEIKTKILPALDAEFAKDLGFETYEELKAKLKQVIEDEGKQKTEREVLEQVEQGLLKNNKTALPPSLVEAQLSHMLDRLRRQVMGGQGKWPEKQLEDLKTKLRPKAEDEVLVSLLLPAIAEKEKIVVSDAELATDLEKNLESADNDEKKESIRKMFVERKEEISGMIRDRKTMQFLRDKAAVKDA
ncbi:MAG: trigger factor [Elusimicrobiota bacterium]